MVRTTKMFQAAVDSLKLFPRQSQRHRAIGKVSARSGGEASAAKACLSRFNNSFGPPKGPSFRACSWQGLALFQRCLGGVWVL